MATETKTNKKSATKPVQETKVAEAEETKVVERKKAKEISMNELIPVRNLCSSSLSYISRKTNMLFQWAEYGDVEHIEFSELMTMKASQPRFLTEPFLFIEDMDVVEKLGLTKLYDQIAQVMDLDNFFGLPSVEMERILNELPNGSKELIKDEAMKRVAAGSLYDIRKIKSLEEKLFVDLQILID